MDISLQAKLLQVMQDGIFSRLGGEGDVRVDVRVIATTKDHLKKSIMEGRFREDLFFRINVINLTIPPLRERREQITPFLQYYFNFYTKKYKKEIPPFSQKLTKLFKEYHWPGNIRELENIVKRIVVLGEEDIASQYFINRNSQDQGRFESLKAPFSESFKAPKGFNLKEIGRKAAEIAEKDIIKATLQETHWNRREAAQLLRVSYKALLYKIQKYHLNNRAVTQKVEGNLDESVK